MTITLYALVMGFGALVTAVGLVLLFRKQEQSQNKIRIFGWEFQFSAPGLAVTLAGCALIVLLPVLGVKDGPIIFPGPNPPLGPSNVVSDKHHSFDTAYPIKLGTLIQGTITDPASRDFYKVQIPSTAAGLPKIRVIVEKGFHARATIYDEKESKVGSDSGIGEDPVSFSFESTPGTYYYIVFESTSGRGQYKLTVTPE